MVKKKREKTQINSIRSDITIDKTDIRIIMKYYEQLYTNKFNNIVGMDKYLERHKLSHSLKKK